jgi:hypothetical protein
MVGFRLSGERLLVAGCRLSVVGCQLVSCQLSVRGRDASTDRLQNLLSIRAGDLHSKVKAGTGPNWEKT